MPVHQISVAPVTKDTTSNGRSSSRSRDKTKDPEGEKGTGRSGGRSSHIKASGSTAVRTAVTLSAQDISSSSTVVRLEENGKENTPVQSMTPASESATLGKRQVKRRHRRRRESPGVGCVTECVETSQKGEPREKERERERSRRTTHTHSDSSEEDEQRWRESRSWNRKKTRRRRSSSQQGGHLRTNAPESRGAADGLELLSVGSDEVGKENQAPEQQPPAKSSKKSSSLPKKEEKTSKVTVHRRASVKEEQASEEGQPIVKSYEEEAEKSGNLSVPVVENPTAAAPEPNGDVQTNAPTNVQTNMVPPDSDEEMEVCRICHCEGDEECPLITPCHCTGSLRFVHQGCLHQWIKSSDTRCCELCNYQFIMETHLKPLRKWEKLHMTTGERRKIFASVTFHLIAVACVLWSLYVLIDRTTLELRMGKHHGMVDWPFWTKLIVVSIGFTGGVIFMYIQCKVYLQLWRRLKAFNRIIFVQNCPETARSTAEAKAPASCPAQTNGRHDGVEVCPAPEHSQAHPGPTHSGGACVTPV